MTTKPNEVAITVEVFQQMLARGNESRSFRVIRGPDPEARITGVRWDANGGFPCVVLEYDRPVEEPVLQDLRVALEMVRDGHDRRLT